jgi:hypothetical protein
MYANGKGVEQNHVEAAKWYRKSAEAGQAPAQYNLGIMYRNGTGVEQDHVEAAEWFRKSAEAGYAKAQCNLSAMYLEGKGVEQDFSKAVRWLQFVLQLAGAQGFKDALTALNHLQQANVIPTPPPGTTITTILLTSANAAKYNKRTGRVVELTEGAAIKPGRAAVLLDGEAAPISIVQAEEPPDPSVKKYYSVRTQCSLLRCKDVVCKREGESSCFVVYVFDNITSN